MSSAALETSRQQHDASSDVLSVFSALSNQDRLTKCLATAYCLATARLVCRRLRDLVDGGVKSIHLSITADKVKTLAREQVLASLLRRWDRCQGLTVELLGNWGDLAPSVQAMPLWLFAGVPRDALARIQRFSLSSRDELANFVLLVSALAARMPSLRHLDLSDCCCGGFQSDEDMSACLYSLFYADLAATCPQLETLELPRTADLSGLEALAGSLVRLRVGAAYIDSDSSVEFSTAALQSISRLKYLRELSFTGRLFEDDLVLLDDESVLIDDEMDIIKGGSRLLNLLDSLPPSVERLGPVGVSSGGDNGMGIWFGFRAGRLVSVDVTDRYTSSKDLRILAYALLQCRAAGNGVGASPQQQRPFMRVREVSIWGHEDPGDIAELGSLRERFSLAPLDAVTFHPPISGDPGVIARCVGGIVSVFGLPRELGAYSHDGLRLGLEDASTMAGAPAVPSAAAITVNTAHRSRAAAMTDEGVSAVSSAAVAPSPHGADSSQAGGSAAPVALDTVGTEDVLRLVAERLWADSGTSGAEGGLAPGSAVVLKGPSREATEWGRVTEAMDAELKHELQRRERFLFCSWGWQLAGPRFAMAICNSSDTAAELFPFASSPDGPCGREGIQATRLRAGAAKAAVQKVLLELWHGSLASARMSPERRVERLVELMLGTCRVAYRDY